MRKRQQGFSLAEILIFALVGSMVLYFMYDIFVASTKQGRDLDRKLKAVQGAQLLLERIERDLKHLIYEKGKYELQVDPDRLGVQFYVYAGHGEDLSEGIIPIEKRVYRFDGAKARVLINEAPFASSHFRAIEFELMDAGGGTHPVLTMRVGGVAEDLAGLPEDATDLRTRADFVSSVGLPAIAAAERDPFWMPSIDYRLR